MPYCPYYPGFRVKQALLKNVMDTRFINISLQTDKEEKGKDHRLSIINPKEVKLV